MRVVLQRVSKASVAVEGATIGAIGPGLLLFLGVEQEDGVDDLNWLVQKIPQIRCFDDADGRMNLSLLDIGGEALVISQFTLFGSLKKGNRPSFNRAALPDHAVPLYERFVAELRSILGRPVPTGAFGQHMRIEAHNDGPVTLFIDSRNRGL